MRVGALLTVALIASVVFCQSASFTTFVKPAVNKYCRRVVSGGAGLFNTVTYVAQLGCLSVNGTQATSGRYGLIAYQVSTLILPNFGLYSFGIEGDAKNVDASLFGVRFGVDSLAEYLETNGEEGYQPGKDKLVKLHPLADLLSGSKWTPPSVTTQKVDNTTTVYKVTTTLTKPYASSHTVKWGVMTTSDEVISGDGITKVVLTPNSLKTVFEIKDFQYTSLNTSSRLAIGTFLIAAGGTAKWDSSVRSKDGERPNEVTDKQAVIGIGASANSKNNGFFSFQKYVSTSDATTQSGTTRTVTLTSSTLVEDKDSAKDIEVSKKEAAITAKRVWFTINERVSQFSWDPSVGNQEEQENQVPSTNSASKLSMILVVVTFLVTLLL